MKGLDHLVLCVNDLEQVAETYRHLGFTVTPRAKHPFGTHNCLVQLDGFFLELLTVAEPEKIPAVRAGHFGFAAFNQNYLARRQGCSMLVMDTDDFHADNQIARQDGLDTYQTFEFSRNAVLPSQEIVEVSFGLNFVTHPQMPCTAFFTCQQFQPEYFWKAEYQRHQNTASQIIEVCLVAEKPAEFADFMASFTRCDHTGSDDGGTIIRTSRGQVAIVSPSGFEERYQATAPDMTDGPLLAGFTIGVNSAPAAPVSVCGAAILFEQVS